jgi:hypothetical protein
MLAAGLGCAAPTLAVDDTADGAGDTSVEFYDYEPPSPEWTAGEARDAIEAALDGRRVTPWDVLDTYRLLVSLGTTNCPGPDGNFEQITGCTTADGYTYAGIAGYSGQDGSVGEPQVVQGTLYGDFEILTPDGLRFAEGGGASAVSTTDATKAEDTFSGLLRGTFVYEGGGVSFADGYSALLYIDAGRSSHGNWLTLDGGAGMDGTDIRFDALSVNAIGVCSAGASGAVEVRAPSGHWYTLTFSDDCTSCGPVTFGGVKLGNECLDLDGFALAYTALLIR